MTFALFGTLAIADVDSGGLMIAGREGSADAGIHAAAEEDDGAAAAAGWVRWHGFGADGFVHIL